MGFGDADGTNNSEGDVRLFDLSGTSNITNSTFGFVPGDALAGENLVEIRNTTGTLTLNVTGSTFHNTADSASGADGIGQQPGQRGHQSQRLEQHFHQPEDRRHRQLCTRDVDMNVNITDGNNERRGRWHRAPSG